jgi:hypothetical protein
MQRAGRRRGKAAAVFMRQGGTMGSHLSVTQKHFLIEFGHYDFPLF